MAAPSPWRRASLGYSSYLRWCTLVLGFLLPLVLASAKKSVNFYDRLGVPKTCSARELSKAYRKAALKHHPDKGGDEDTFKEISKAYEALSDPEKRKLYDQYGEVGIDPSMGGGGGPFKASQGGGAGGGFSPKPGTQQFFFNQGDGMDTNEFLRQFTQQSSGFGGTGAGSADIESFLREMMGGGGTPRSSAGMFTPKHSQSQPQQQRTPVVKPFTRPLSCSLEDLATGRLKKVRLKMPKDGRSRLFQVQLQKGWKAGTKLKYPATQVFPAVTLVVREKPHPTLLRRDNDLVYRVATATTTIEVTLPDGEVWKRRLPRTMRTGDHVTISEKGMPIKGGPARGDLILEFK